MANENKNIKPPPMPDRRNKAEAEEPPQMRGVITWILVAILIFWMFQMWQMKQEKVEEIAYNPTFINCVTNNQIKQCEIVKEVTGIEYIKGEMIPPANDQMAQPKKFKVFIAKADEQLEKLLVSNGVHYSIFNQNPYLPQLLTSVLPIVLIFGFLYFLFMRQIK
jgi:cell division protease FtsH